MAAEKLFTFINEAAARAYKRLPREIQNQFGNDLNAVQHGEPPFSDFEDLSDSIGPGVIELKENGSPAFRAIYCAKHLNTVYILHAFTKTTNGTDRKAMATADKRYKDMMAEVREASKEAKKVGKH